MTANNSTIDLVSINSDIKFGQNLSIWSQDIDWKGSFGVNQGHISLTNLRKMTANNSNIDLVSINSYIKIGQNLSICSQDIDWK